MLIDSITDNGEEAIMYQMDAAVSLFPCIGFWSSGTLIETAEGPKAIEEIQVGDCIVVHDAFETEQY